MSFNNIEDSLIVLSKTMFNDREHDFKKYEANEIFSDLLYLALERDNSFEYKFDSIPFLSIQGPTDKSFRIFSWYLRNDKGKYEFFAYFQSFNKYRKRYEVIELIDNTNEIDRPNTSVLDADNWYGCVYYDVNIQKRKGRTFYTLFGWKPVDALEQQKIIEVITLKSKGVPRFGYPLFSKKKTKDKRIILKYSSKANCLLRYEDHYVNYRKKRLVALPKSLSKSPRFKQVTKKRKMIIMDRLVTENPEMEKQVQFIIPSGDVYDAYIYENGKFRFRENVDARNPEIPKRRRKEQKPSENPAEKGLFEPDL